MRAVFIFVVLLILIAMAVPVSIAGQFWMDGRAVIVRAEQNGALRAPARGRLTTAERTIAMHEFPHSWGMHAVPCRTLAFLWAELSMPDWDHPGTPVSQKLAAALQPEQHATSVRWQLRRLVVACQLEQRFDDTQLLRLWLARASFGHGAVGLESAAQAVFQKPSRELNAEESARLAALLRAPSLRNQPDRWAERAQTIQQRVAARTR